MGKKTTKKRKTIETFLGKDFWTGLGVIIALFCSIFSFWQSYETGKRQATQDKKQEEQYQETRHDLKIERLKNEAREWFTYGEYDKSFESYQEVTQLDSFDSEGYRKFLNMGNILKANKKKWQDDPIILKFFERAELLKP